MNNNITLPNGNTLSFSEIDKSLATDNIVINKPDEKHSKFLSNYYSSYLQRTVIANRYPSMDLLFKYINTKLTDILSTPFIEEHIPHIVGSTEIILNTMKNNGKILLVSDFDVDGVTSAAVGDKLIRNLFDYDNLEVIVNKRSHGNGINDTLTKMLLQYENIDLIILSDHGSDSKINMGKVKDKLGCKVIVTDHHTFDEETAPFNMDAFINPQRYDNDFKDMSGTAVLYFTLIHAYKTLHKYIPTTKENYLYYVLTYVGLTVISDCMDLKNYINRKIVIKALTDINSSKINHEPFWVAMKQKVATSYIIDETVLGYEVTPILNSPGRLGDPRISYEFLTMDNYDNIDYFLEELANINTKRKSKQTTAVEAKDIEEYTNGIVKVMLVDNSDGVQGIISNNVMYDENYKVVIVFTKKIENGEVFLTGSGRSQVDGMSLKDIVTTIAEKSDILIKFGGHKKAIGIRMKPKLKEFYTLLKEEVSKHKVEAITEYPVDEYIYSDKKLLLNLYDIIDISPFGIGFSKPQFASDFYIESYRIFKKSNYYLSLTIKLNATSNTTFSTFYTIKDDELEEFENNLKHNKFIRMVYTMDINSYRNFNKIMFNALLIKFPIYLDK